MLKHVVKNICTLMEQQEEYLTLSEAAEYLDVSRVTIWRRVRDGTLSTYQASTSRREKLVKLKDLDDLQRPRRISPTRDRTRRVRKARNFAGRQPSK